MVDLEPRTVDLELRFMKLERELHDLSDVVAAQQHVIDALTREARRRRERDSAEEDAAGGRAADERPPHY